MKMKKHTKIVATISDKQCDVPFLQELFNEGMNVVRLNSAHLDEKGIRQIVHNVREVSDRIALLVDTKGPEIRTTVTENPIQLKAGDRVNIVSNPEGISSRETIYLSCPNNMEEIHVGDGILIDDGEIELKVEAVDGDQLICVATNQGVVGSRKSVN
ncbi:MAG: pyruvate kinase, partial [Bacteroidota bacterium]|nr:pyruvate kinase [Bacteroidota bacterium]